MDLISGRIILESHKGHKQKISTVFFIELKLEFGTKTDKYN